MVRLSAVCGEGQGDGLLGVADVGVIAASLKRNVGIGRRSRLTFWDSDLSFWDTKGKPL